MTDPLGAATCIIYIVLAFPVLYALIRHRREGLLGWLFLFIFCGIRIISGGLGINDSSSAASILSTVGLSPLLLATFGILHEARAYRVRNIKKSEMVRAILFHVLVVTGLALIVAGSAKLQNHEHPIDLSKKIIGVGIAFLAISWGALVLSAGVTFTAQRAENVAAAREGTVLFISVCVSIGFIGVRVFYSLIALCSQKAYLNPATGTITIRLVLVFLPEVIATLAYVAAGIKTQGLAKLADNGTGDLSLSYKPDSAQSA